MQIRVRYVPVPDTGAVFAGTVWKMPTRGIPVPNPNSSQYDSGNDEFPLDAFNESSKSKRATGIVMLSISADKHATTLDGFSRIFTILFDLIFTFYRTEIK